MRALRSALEVSKLDFSRILVQNPRFPQLKPYWATWFTEKTTSVMFIGHKQGGRKSLS